LETLVHKQKHFPHCQGHKCAQKIFNVPKTAEGGLDFVLSQYVKVGVQELDQEKLSPLLKLKYNNAIADAVADLGRPEEIGKVFSGFQKYLYQRVA
jgi:hypothetical protein